MPLNRGKGGKGDFSIVLNLVLTGGGNVCNIFKKCDHLIGKWTGGSGKC